MRILKSLISATCVVCLNSDADMGFHLANPTERADARFINFFTSLSLFVYGFLALAFAASPGMFIWVSHGRFSFGTTRLWTLVNCKHIGLDGLGHTVDCLKAIIVLSIRFLIFP